MTVYVPGVHVRRPHLNAWLVALVGLVAIVLAGVVGYAIAGGFTTESSPGQKVADRVLNAYATGDAASIAATYDPAVKVVLIYDGAEHVIASNAKEETGVIKDAIASGVTLKQIGAVSTYEAEDGDLYVAHSIELTSPTHPNGIPVIGFYRVHDGKVIRQIGLDAEHY
jgi:hypothetical protein